MSKKLFVSNLALDIDSDQLVGVFAEFGTVTSANLLVDNNTGHNIGAAFVEMSSEPEAKKIIQHLNGKKLSDRAIEISEATPQDRRNLKFQKKSSLNMMDLLD